MQPPAGAIPPEGLLPPQKGSNPLKEDYWDLTRRSLKKYRDKLVSEQKAWEGKNKSGRGRKATNDWHIEELKEEIAQIEQVLS